MTKIVEEIRRVLILILLIGLTQIGSAQSTNGIKNEKIAPNFDFTQLDNSTSNLYAFEGKVIYLSIWASWCKPCLKGFKNYKELRRTVHDMGIILLNISVDEDEEAWRQAVEKYDIIGYHGNSSIDNMKELFGVYSIPRYEIIGKNKEFLFFSEDSNRDIVKEFESFLNR